jgi:hypothetical protein
MKVILNILYFWLFINDFILKRENKRETKKSVIKLNQHYHYKGALIFIYLFIFRAKSNLIWV